MKNSILLILAFVAVAAHAATTNLTGVVTFERNDLSFFFIDDAAGVHWRVQGEKGAPTVKIGDLVHVEGEREMTTKRRIADAAITVEGHAMAAIPPPLETGIANLFSRLMPFGNTDLYGGVVVTEGAAARHQPSPDDDTAARGRRRFESPGRDSMGA